MTIRVALHHRTEYKYDRLVGHSPHIIRLRPAPHSRTPIISHSLRIEPTDHFLNWQQDPFSNWMARVVFPGKSRNLAVQVDLVAEMTVINPFDFFLEPHAEFFPFKYEAWLEEELAPFRRIQKHGPTFNDYVASVPRGKRQTTDFLVALNQEVQRAVKYLIRMEPGVQSPEETLVKGSGSCRDSAWLLVHVLRHLGFAARFVSGYLIQLVPDVKPLDGPAGPPADFTDLHAWTEVYLPGAGWVGLDPTSGLLAGEGHIPLAATPEPASAAPVTGAVDKCESEFAFEMKVTRIHEDPRVTKPYTDAQWAEIEGLGHRVDARLKSHGLTMTMGGEPTFVANDDMDSPEWNTDAVGPTKRERAGQLVRRMRDRFAAGGLLHYGTGKWYPGESLPRWALSCWWRRDGVAAWRDDALVARDGVRYGHTAELGEKFLKALAKRLSTNPKHVIAGYEDVYYYLWREAKLPVNVDPFDAKLDEKEERDRLRRIFDQGLSAVVGHALPLSKGPLGLGGPWVSGEWPIRDARMHLIPGDSPMGLRLPLNSLPWVSEEKRNVVEPLDPTAPRAALPVFERRAAEGPTTGIAEQTLPTDADPILRTAVCVEPREGMLHVFMPPMRTIDHYLELVSAVEDTAADFRTPVRIEGYPPPHDPRVNHFKVTPDPGVIEVNVHPAHSWSELVDITTGVYEDAFQCKLGTEKFMLDGRHSGTGGGNHVVVGGPSPLESPLLQRPDILRSLVAYWHNHPALSYLFSGTFVGPTSQAPRVDEARHDAVYELEIAFEQLKPGMNPQPWLVDRVLRNLLVDTTGNTHRAEFCIDKLYSPDSATGRLGLLELRAFEMPPHARMSLTQALLLRTLMAEFAERPYERELVRWGTTLHDRFLLPHFVWQDVEDVVADLNRAGWPFDASWFAPHWEFRFPSYGSCTYQGVELDLRQAIEPWHVLGEEPGGGGTTRFVDSSVERLQVKARGLVDTRHVATVNGRALPLHPTGTNGEFVAGVRYRAWQPPHCLHPTIGVHAPLVFDLVDSWSGRSMGGFTYHVAHPGGRNYATFPVNANEAEARRVARYFKFGHTPGPMAVPAEKTNRYLPLTLDLRRRPAE